MDSPPVLDTELAILAALPDKIILAWDPQQNIRYTSPLAAEILNATPETLQGQPLNAHDKHPLLAQTPSFVENASPPWTMRDFALTIAGETHWFDLKVVEHAGFTILWGDDVSARQRELQQLQNEVDMLGPLFDAIPDATIVAGPDRRIRRINASARTLFGYTNEELKGQLTKTLYARVADYYRQGDRRFNQAPKDHYVPYNNLYRCKNGRIFTGETLINSVCNAAGELLYFIGLIRDITEREKTRDELALYERIANTSNDLLVFLDPDYRFRAVNNRYLQAIGLQRYEIIGHTVAEVRGAPFFENTLKPRLDACLQGEDMTFTHPSQLGDGTQVMFESHLLPFWNSKGEISGVVAIIRDITQQQAAEARLVESEARYRELIQSMTNGVAVYEAVEGGEDFVFKELNPAGCRLGQTRREDVVGRKVTEVFPGVKDFGLFEVFQRVYRTGRPEHFPMTRYADSRIAQWVENLVYRLPNGEVVAVYEDSTERHQALEMLHIQNRALASATNGIIITESASPQAIIYANPAFEKMTGYRLEEVVGRSCGFLQGEDREQPGIAVIRAAIARGEACEVRLRNFRKNGTQFLVGLSISPVFGSQGELTHFVGIQEDLTEKVRLEKELQQAQKMEALGQLTGGIAHDFNNILASVLGFADLALRGHRMVSAEKLDHYLTMILTSGQRAQSLIAQMLLFSRPDTSQIAPLDIRPQIKEIIKLLQSTLPASIQVSMETATEIPRVRITPVHIQQVLMNLAINARDAMGEKGLLTIRLDTRRFSLRPCSACHEDVQGEWVVLSVSDTGCGISEEILPKIFDPFFTTKDVSLGTGLGLSTTMQIVRGHGGHFLVESAAGKGTSIHVLLPKVVPETSLTEAPRTTRQPARGHGERLLVVDDEPSIAEYLSELLISHGYAAQATHSAEEALALMAQAERAYDLVISDYSMPRMHGVDLVTTMRERQIKAAVILLTGNTRQIDARQCAALDIIEILNKPVESDRLLEKIDHILKEAQINSGASKLW